jgi:hypothetical protein
MESSPPMVETMPWIEGSANACMRSCARASGWRSSHSGAALVCAHSTTVTPSAASSCRLPAS